LNYHLWRRGDRAKRKELGKAAYSSEGSSLFMYRPEATGAKGPGNNLWSGEGKRKDKIVARFP